MTIFWFALAGATIFIFVLGFVIGQSAGWAAGYGDGKFAEEHKGSGITDSQGITL